MNYPDNLNYLVNEACETFIEGRYNPCLLLTSLSVEWVLISEFRRRKLWQQRDGLESLIKKGKGMAKYCPFRMAGQSSPERVRCNEVQYMAVSRWQMRLCSYLGQVVEMIPSDGY